MKKTIFTIGYEIPWKSELAIDFSWKSSLMDADIVLFNPKFYGYEHYEQYLGKTLFSQTSSFSLYEDIKHWKKELHNFLTAWKTIFLLLTKKEEFYLHTWNKDFSWTGRNRVTTNLVELHNNYEILPIKLWLLTSATGKYIEFSWNNIFSDFYNNFYKNLEYELYIENSADAQIIFTGKDKTKILGAIYKVENWHIITLPYLKYNESEFTEYNEKQEEFWTDEWIRFWETLNNCLINIDKSLRQESTKTISPERISEKEFSIENATNIEKKIIANQSKINKIQDEIKNLTENLIEENKLKDLLFEQSTYLEDAVIKALQILWYEAENYNDGILELDQVIISPEGHRFIGECEGKNTKPINIDKFRQLLESLNADFARDDIKEKAFWILFGNPERLISPIQRTLDFTEKCLIGAKREKIALIKTTDLFKIVKYLKENNNEEYKKQCREAIYNGLWEVVIFPKLPIE